ncbi:hypothetical protein [Frateuria sp. Soil773]|uniref:hypothetical protein n=1 Tax=Frateuria sp. Soil773 TaxID=1736407 RepID=UPI0012FB5CFB|nr:hypothetical protein [Frateuria sp. Soil773]
MTCHHGTTRSKQGYRRLAETRRANGVKLDVQALHDPLAPHSLQYAVQDGGGDGTVPCSSGAMPRSLGGNGIKQQFGLKGFKHEGSYRDSTAQIVTLYALQKIAAAAKVPT